MGEIKAIIELKNDRDLFLLEKGEMNESDVRVLTIEAMVDTGVVMLLLPQDMVEKLGLKIEDRVILTLANDEKIELDVAGTLSIKICGRKMKTDCLVGPPRCEPLIGQIILERLDLVLDPVKQAIMPRPESPYLPSLKLK